MESQKMLSPCMDQSYFVSGRRFRRSVRFLQLENQEHDLVTRSVKRIKTAMITGPQYAESQRPMTVAYSYPVALMDTLTDDLLLYMFSFIVCSENAQVDGTTFRSITCVCKSWEIVSNSYVLWSKPNNEHKKNRLFAWKDTSTSDDITSALIAFTKVGPIKRCQNGELVYMIRDRAKKELYTMKTRDMTIGCTEQLRELHAAHLIMGSVFMDARANTYCTSVPIGVDIQGDRLLTWYHPTQQSLQEWFDSSVNCMNATKLQVPNVLPISLYTLKNWMRDLCTAIIAINDDSYLWADFRHVFHGDVCPKSILIAHNGESLCLACPSRISERSQLHCRSPNSLPRTQLAHSKSDSWALGCICAQIARCGIPLFSAQSSTHLLRQIQNIVGSSLQRKKTFCAFLKKEIPTLDDDGRDFIQRLLHPNLRERMHAREALRHPFLSDQKESRNEPFDLTGLQLYRALEREKLYNPMDSTKYHVDDYQWAALTDWLFEVAEVHTSAPRQSVFQAMTYFDMFLSSYGEIPWERHQLTLGACFLLATQIDLNSVAISARDLTFLADNTFATHDVDVCLRFILENLKFSLAVPTIASFSHAYIAKLIIEDESTQSMILLLSELALQTPMYLKFYPSMIAACVVVLANHTLGIHPLWPDSLSIETDYKWHDLGDCLIQLSRALEHVRISMPQLKMIARRYRGELHGQGRSLAIARVTSFASLTNELPGMNHI